jgi:hypothetical protein
MHKRQALRYSIVRLLKGVTGAGDRVYPNRPTPLWTQELPCICVYTQKEPVSDVSRPTIYYRDLQLVVECVCEADQLMDDVLDGMAEQVEAAFGSLGETGALEDEDDVAFDFADRVDLSGTDVSISSEGENYFGSCRLTISIPYKAGWSDFPESNDLDDFKTANAKIETPAGHTGAEAEDTITVQP